MRQRLLPFSLCFLPLVLTGCSLSPTITSSPKSAAGSVIHGLVHGGQQPIVGAHVYLLAANTTGYGGNGIAPSSANASISLLNASSTGYSDSIGAYVPTGNYGYFDITGDYTCTPGQQVYIYALGGNPGAGTNSAAGLMAALSTCPTAGNLATTTPNVIINEVSTIAAAYAFAGFATDATHVSSSGTPLAQTGIANAFANASNLASLSTGVALTTTPAGNGTVPQSEINTLANILAACVNSPASTSSSCSTLFTNAESAGATGTIATDTATAAINIAHYPGTNISALYALETPSSPFIPALTGTTPPGDFAIALQFTGGTIFYPYAVAIDAGGNVWSTDGGKVTKMSSTGAFLSGSGGYTASGIQSACGLAIDQSGNAWVTNLNGDSVSEISNTGAGLAQYAYYTRTGSSMPYAGYIEGPRGVSIDGQGNAWIASEDGNGITKISSNGAISGVAPFGLSVGLPSYTLAIDGSGNAWIPDMTNYAVFKFSSSLSLLSGTAGFSANRLGTSNGIAFDSGGNAWVYGNGLYKFSNSGTLLSPATGYAAASPVGSIWPLAIDGAGNVWIGGSIEAYNGSIQEVSNSGTTLLSGSTGYGKALYEAPLTIAVDGSGDVWYGNSNTGYGSSALTELVGIAIPVITPIAAGLPATPTTDGSSSLGTRP